MFRFILYVIAGLLMCLPAYSQKIIGSYESDTDDDELILKKKNIVYQDSVVRSESKNLVFENAVIKAATQQEETIILVGNYEEANVKKICLIGLDNLTLNEKWQYVADNVSSVFTEASFQKKMKLPADTVRNVVLRTWITVEEELVNLTNQKLYIPEGCRISHELMTNDDELVIGGTCKYEDDSAFYLTGLDAQSLEQKWHYSNKQPHSVCKGLLRHNDKLYALSRQNDSMQVYAFENGELFKRQRLHFVNKGGSLKDKLLGKGSVRLKLDVEKESNKFRFRLEELDIAVLEPFNNLKLDNFYNIERLNCELITSKDTVSGTKQKALRIKTRQMNERDAWEVRVYYENGNTFKKQIGKDILKRFARFEIALKDTPRFIIVHSNENKGLFYKYLRDEYESYALD